MLHQVLILTSHREYAHSLRLGLLGLTNLHTRIDVELDALRAMQLVPQQYDLIIIDNMLDSMDGLQLLQLMKHQAPTTKFIVVSDAADEVSRADAYRSGADFFLERPRTPDSLKIAINAIVTQFKSGNDSQLLSGEQEGPAVKVADIVQTRCLSGDTVLLLVRGKKQSGDIFIYRGEVFHAQYPGKSGETAFYEMCRWDNGLIHVKDLKLNHTPPRTIEIGYRQLLENAQKPLVSMTGKLIANGDLRLVPGPRGPGGAVPDVVMEAPPLDLDKLWEGSLATAGPLPVIPTEDGTPLPQVNSHWRVSLMGELLEGSQVSEPDRCAFITYFIYRKLAEVAVALEVDYFTHLTLFGPHLNQILVADNLGIRHAVFSAARTTEADLEQYVKWCCEQTF
ncbi:MAG TPA: response regulator [Candidatus Methylacidiphilales bacterium]|nr:response regulator [Candidatus Methylacidiphilales bacterium]